MNTEDANNLVAEDELPSDTELDVEANAHDEDSTEEDTDLEEDNQEDDGEDIEHDGKKYRVPKELKDAFLMRSDYTRKTQEVAAEREAVKAERENFAKQQEEHKALISDHARVQTLKDALKTHYHDGNVDWQAVEAQYGTDAANRERWNYQDLQHQLQKAEAELQAKEGRLREQHVAEATKALQETGKTLAQHITGWNEAKAKELLDFGVTLGFTADELLGSPDPRAFLAINELKELRQFKAKHTAGQRAAKQATTAPVKIIGTKSPPASPMSDKSDMKTWIAARNKQLGYK